MAHAPRWKGSDGVQESPDSPEITVSADKVTIVRKYEGPYNAVKSARPALASEMEGYPGVYVETHRLSHAPGKRGLLTVTASISRGDPDSGPASNPSPLADPVIEIDWIRVTRPVENHPFFSDLTDADRSNVKKWAEDQAKYTGATTMEGLPLKLGQKLLRGTDSYDLWCPVVKYTTEHNGRPNTGECGVPSTPEVKPEGNYVYLKTADNAVRRNRRWTRTQEWTGADQIDEDLYPSG